MVTQRDTNSAGPVEASVRALVASMGTLRHWEQVTADTAVALARAVDIEVDGAKLSALSRELRQVVGVLARVGEKPTVEPAAPPADVIGDLVDEVARRRAQRGA